MENQTQSCSVQALVLKARRHCFHTRPRFSSRYVNKANHFHRRPAPHRDGGGAQKHRTSQTWFWSSHPREQIKGRLFAFHVREKCRECDSSKQLLCVVSKIEDRSVKRENELSAPISSSSPCAYGAF
ncbi:unnamed protein product [Ectocarpus sp. 13 AM-2016]